jgi:hypothetical protein
MKKLQKLEIFRNILFFMKFELFDSLHEPVGENEKTTNIYILFIIWIRSI